jgi:two-component system, cell cycle sensor histidine kinase and response regulator CckA
LAQSRETIVLVEDDIAIRDVTSRLLAKMGYGVLVAASGSEALALIDHGQVAPNLLLSDMFMPIMDGWELSLKLRRSLPELPVLLISGESESVLAGRYGLEGVSFLQKPFTAAALAGKLREVLDGDAG